MVDGRPGTAARQEVPEEVAALARAHRLGKLTDVRRGVSPHRVVTVGWGSAALALLLTLTFAQETTKAAAPSALHALLQALTIAFLFVFAAGTAYGIRALLAGPRALYLYAGGLVHTDRRGARAVPWPTVTRLRPIHQRGPRGTPGRLLGYRLVTRDGTSFTVPLIPAGGRDEFTERIVSSVGRHG
ncbi:hypothetical protein [Kitasatospora viridis]|uniref:Uncharacterized protein n=1 Tax=Kitasatospora viridis TaxID=281105 RepID=A0A561S9G2_9ACTN|nr:hypothetical protein [Kitasatospora viridis]TWF71494.1 hypothetical protein FHX73_19124 [Kitasatospora viridis]